MSSAGRSSVPTAAHVNRAMRDFVAGAGRRRLLPPRVHVGLPRREVLTLEDADWYDDALRADLLTRVLDALSCPGPLAWLDRSGALEPTDSDLRWLAAARAAFGRHGRHLPGFYLITRQGWSDLIGGDRHEWARVRRCTE